MLEALERKETSDTEQCLCGPVVPSCSCWSPKAATNQTMFVAKINCSIKKSKLRANKQQSACIAWIYRILNVTCLLEWYVTANQSASKETTECDAPNMVWFFAAFGLHQLQVGTTGPHKHCLVSLVSFLSRASNIYDKLVWTWGVPLVSRIYQTPTNHVPLYPVSKKHLATCCSTNWP